MGGWNRQSQTSKRKFSSFKSLANVWIIGKLQKRIKINSSRMVVNCWRYYYVSIYPLFVIHSWLIGGSCDILVTKILCLDLLLFWYLKSGWLYRGVIMSDKNRWWVTFWNFLFSSSLGIPHCTKKPSTYRDSINLGLSWAIKLVVFC